MKRLARLVAVASLAALAGCETTGDPRQGGLFGWSESKAQGRQAQKQAHVAGAEAELTHEAARGDELRKQKQATDRSLAETAKAQRIRSENDLRALRDLRARLVAKAKHLEENSLTDATASRARAYRAQAEATYDAPLPLQQQVQRLRALETKIDGALARLNR